MTAPEVDVVAEQLQGLAEAHKEVCDLLCEQLANAGTPEAAVRLVSSWEESHSSYLFALRLAGSPLVHLHRPRMPFPGTPANVTPEGWRSRGWPPAWPAANNTVLHKCEGEARRTERGYHVVAFSADNYQALRDAARQLQSYLSIGHVAIVNSMVITAAVIASGVRSPASIGFLLLALVWAILLANGQAHKARLFASGGYLVVEAVAMSAAFCRPIEVLAVQLTQGSTPRAIPFIVVAWILAGIIAGGFFTPPRHSLGYALLAIAMQSCRIVVIFVRSGNAIWICRVLPATSIPFVTGYLLRRVTSCFSGNFTHFASVLEQCQLPSHESQLARPHLARRPDGPPHDLPGRCTICFESPLTHCFVPCGHRCTCGQCGDAWYVRNHSCPMCRTPSIGCIRVFDAV